MNEVNLPAIEPVTERDIDEVLNARAAGYDIRYALEQDRRRVAERQARSYKREKDCATADDWRHRSRHLEAEWGRCSQQCAVMQGERDAARAEVARLTAANGWQPIETAPRDGSWFLAVSAGVDKRTGRPWQPGIVAINADGDYVPDDFHEDYFTVCANEWPVTHWMPLPAPPKEPTP